MKVNVKLWAHLLYQRPDVFMIHEHSKDFLFIPSTDDTFSGTNISSVAAEGACSLALMAHAVFLALQNSKATSMGLA